MTVQFVEIAGQKMAMLPVAEFERLVDLAEDKLDCAAATAAELRRGAGEEYVPIELTDRILAGETPLRVWRQYRGLSQDGLGKIVGLSKVGISRLELNKGDTSRARWRALAEALNVDVEDILPIA